MKRFITARNVVLAVGVGFAAAVYYSLDTTRTAEPTSSGDRPLNARAVAHNEKNAEYWSSGGFVALDEPRQVEAVLRNLVANRFCDARIDPEPLVAALGEFLYSFGAHTTGEFLNRLPRGRALIDSPFDDELVHSLYRAASGLSMSPDMSASDCLAYFWNLSKEQSGRPTSLGRVGVVEIVLSKPYPQSGPKPGIRLFAQVMPQFSAEGDKEWRRWIGPMASALASLTQPEKSFDDLLKQQRRVLIATVCVPIGSDRGVVSAVGIRLFKGRNESRWHILSAWHYSPEQILWPY